MDINNDYKWEKRNSDLLNSRIDGVNSSTLTILNLRPEDVGEYRCLVSNATGRITSDYAKLEVQGMTK